MFAVFLLLLANSEIECHSIYHLALSDNAPYYVSHGNRTSDTGIVNDYLKQKEDVIQEVLLVNSSEFFQIVKSTNSTAALLPYLPNIKNGAIVYISSISDSSLNNEQFCSLTVINSYGSAVVVRNADALLLLKLFTGIRNCFPIIYFATLIAVIAGFFVWLFEHRYNDEFPKSFGPGLWVGFWFCCVTMTTVGFGDKTPKHWATRSICIFWMMFALMIVAMVTSTVMDQAKVSNLKNKHVAVLRDSYESKRVERYLSASRKLFNSYPEILDALTVKVVDAAFLDMNVAAFHFHRFSRGEKLKVQQIIINQIPIRVFYTGVNIKCNCSTKTTSGQEGDDDNDSFRSLMMVKYNLSISAEPYYVREVRKLFNDDDNGLMRYVTITSACLILLGILVEVGKVVNCRYRDVRVMNGFDAQENFETNLRQLREQFDGIIEKLIAENLKKEDMKISTSTC